jgi:hypothetical protein
MSPHCHPLWTTGATCTFTPLPNHSQQDKDDDWEVQKNLSMLDQRGLVERIREFENLALRLKMKEKVEIAKGKAMKLILYDL